MFSGIIEEIGIVNKISDHPNSKKFKISCSNILSDSKIGESLSCNGVCLTITSISNNQFDVDIVNETLNCTTLKTISEGSKINLERSIRYKDRIGGHLVQGHVDGLAKVENIHRTNEYTELELIIDKDLRKYCIHKGSIAIDGVSLTIAGLTNHGIKIALIPHTLDNTILSNYKVNNNVNIEFDMIAKYVESFLEKK